MTLHEALDRTLLLMRDEVDPAARDEELIAALTGTRIALVADDANIASHSSQTAFVTAALLMARSGHCVHLITPDVPMVGVQLPIGSGALVTKLITAGLDMLPGVELSAAIPNSTVDLVVAFGDTKVCFPGERTIRLNATDWSGSIVREGNAARWQSDSWPLGGMASAVLAAVEAFKCSMHKLRHAARNPERMETVFAPSDLVEFRLAPEDTPKSGSLGAFDCISGGAIIHAALYALARLPGLEGYARVIEPDCADLSNLNRYAILLRSNVGLPKAEHLVNAFAGTGLKVEQLNLRYDEKQTPVLPLAQSVLVGVDDIPTRWLVQRSNPDWLSIGATTHWCAMASFHQEGLGCAECLHPYDDPGGGPIPTVAFVSFWAGLLTASYYLRYLVGQPATADEQQTYVAALRGENASRSGVPIKPDCPTCTFTRADHMKTAGSNPVAACTRREHKELFGRVLHS